MNNRLKPLFSPYYANSGHEASIKHSLVEAVPFSHFSLWFMKAWNKNSRDEWEVCVLFFIFYFRFILFIAPAREAWCPLPLTCPPAADALCPSPPLFYPPRFLSLSHACANGPSHQHIELDYNLICCGRDGIEQQIIANEENQSPEGQISRKLVRSDWFGHRRRMGGIWQITASQVDWETDGE